VGFGFWWLECWLLRWRRVLLAVLKLLRFSHLRLLRLPPLLSRPSLARGLLLAIAL